MVNVMSMYWSKTFDELCEYTRCYDIIVNARVKGYSKHNAMIVCVVKWCGFTYLNTQKITERIDDVLFWHMNYNILSGNDPETAQIETREFANALGQVTYYDEFFAHQGRERILVRIKRTGRPYVISDDKFLRLFPEAREMSKELAQHRSAADRKKKSREVLRFKKEKEGNTKAQKIIDRREKVFEYKVVKGFTNTTIADILKVSLSTIEKDIKALKDAGRMVTSRGKKLLKDMIRAAFSKKNGKTNDFDKYLPKENVLMVKMTTENSVFDTIRDKNHLLCRYKPHLQNSDNSLFLQYSKGETDYV